jgi:DNA-binding transcriptional LysR family regulator
LTDLIPEAHAIVALDDDGDLLAEARNPRVRGRHPERAGQFDAAIVASLHGAHERFGFSPILTDDIVVAFAEAHQFAHRQTIGIGELYGEPLVVGFDKDLANRLETSGVARLQRYRSNDPRWVAEFVRNGLGCALVPRATALSHALDHRTLKGLPLR